MGIAGKVFKLRPLGRGHSNSDSKCTFAEEAYIWYHIILSTYFTTETQNIHCSAASNCEVSQPTSGRAFFDFHNVNKNILDVQRYTDFLGYQLNCLYIGIQRKIKAAPSTATALVTIFPDLRDQYFAILGLQNNQLNLRRRYLIFERQAVVAVSDGHRDFQNGVTRARSKRGFQIVHCGQNDTQQGTSVETALYVPFWFIFYLHNFPFYYSVSALLGMQTALIERGILSVCLSVHPSHSGVLSRRFKIPSCGFQRQVEQTF